MQAENKSQMKHRTNGTNTQMKKEQSKAGECVYPILWRDSAIYDSLAPLFYCLSTLNANIK